MGLLYAWVPVVSHYNTLYKVMHIHFLLYNKLVQARSQTTEDSVNSSLKQLNCEGEGRHTSGQPIWFLVSV